MVDITKPQPRYRLLCPCCRELWAVDWMRRAGVRVCPVCEVEVLACIGPSAYHEARVRPCVPPSRAGVEES